MGLVFCVYFSLYTFLLATSLQQITRNHALEVRQDHQYGKSGVEQPPGNIPLPPMGWNSWNALGCNTSKINERKLKSIINILVDSGLAGVGYKYVNIDDCWLDPAMTGGGQIHKEMNSTTIASAPRVGPLRADPDRFTSGSLKNISTYAHDRGLRFGTYLDAGLATCQGYAGSLGFEEDDARVLASWGVDYLKLDGCSMEGMEASEIYSKWSRYLRDTGRDIVFSCSFPAYIGENDEQFPENFDWEKIQRIWAEHGPVLRKYHKTNGYNDPDMLEIGNAGMTLAEGRTQMSIWAILAAPLILGNDLEKMTEEELAILTNKEVLDVNQDSFVSQGHRIVNSTGRSIWIRELHDRSVAIATVNLQDSPQMVQFCWDNIATELKGLSVSSLMNNGCEINVRDLWSRVNIGQNGVIDPKLSPCLNSTSMISPHGTFFVRTSFSSKCFESSDFIEEFDWNMFSM